MARTKVTARKRTTGAAAQLGNVDGERPAAQQDRLDNKDGERPVAQQDRLGNKDGERPAARLAMRNYTGEYPAARLAQFRSVHPAAASFAADRRGEQDARARRLLVLKRQLPVDAYLLAKAKLLFGGDQGPAVARHQAFLLDAEAKRKAFEAALLPGQGVCPAALAAMFRSSRPLSPKAALLLRIKQLHASATGPCRPRLWALKTQLLAAAADDTAAIDNVAQQLNAVAQQLNGAAAAVVFSSAKARRLAFVAALRPLAPPPDCARLKDLVLRGDNHALLASIDQHAERYFAGQRHTAVLSDFLQSLVSQPFTQPPQQQATGNKAAAQLSAKARLLYLIGVAAKTRPDARQLKDALMRMPLSASLAEQIDSLAQSSDLYNDLTRLITPSTSYQPSSRLNSTTSSLFHSTSSTSSTTSSLGSSTTSSLFGSSTTSSLFGSSTTSSLFGSSTTSSLGSSTTSSLFGSSHQSSLFDQAKTDLLGNRYPGLIFTSPSWFGALQHEFDKPYFGSLYAKYAAAAKSGDVFPPAALIFRALELCPLADVKVVILGQDPYFQPGQAMGLSFSVPRGVAMPPSLVNIVKEIEQDLGCPGLSRASGDLTAWAEQGVLLLNATLTVRRGAPNSHADFGWQTFTDAVLEVLAAQRQPVVFILWGAYAQKKHKLLAASQSARVVLGAHPSPLAGNKFFGGRYFSRANSLLEQAGRSPIDWAAPFRPAAQPSAPSTDLPAAVAQWGRELLQRPVQSLSPSAGVEVVLLVGMPGCGKSHFSTALAASAGGQYERVNRDTLGSVPACLSMARQALAAGRSVIIDNTNPSPDKRRPFVELAREYSVPIRAVVLDVPDSVCRTLNAQRQPSAVVPPIAYSVWRKHYVPPSQSEGFSEVVSITTHLQSYFASRLA